jgi:serine/threonine protein kinase
VIECPNCNIENRPTAHFCAACRYKFPVGEVLGGEYRVTRMLKVGGMGAVYEAESAGQRFAIKEMRDRFVSNKERQEAVNRFLREAMTLAKLDHPRIPKVYHHFIEGDRYYLVMDFVQGEDLAEMLARAPGGRLPEQQVIEWGLQICEVLAYLHCQPQPVIFRDMKPANLMVTPQGKIKLIDFGIARLFNPAQRGGASLVGTPGYAAPEQYQGVAEPRSDIYGLGAALHHLLTGRDPTDTSQQLFAFAPLRHYDPHLSPALEQVIQRALAMKMEDRFGSVEEMRQALQRAARPPVPWSKRVKEFFDRLGMGVRALLAKPWLRWGALAASALIAIAGFAAFFGLKSPASLIDSHLAFVSDRDGLSTIYVMDERGQVTWLMDDKASDHDPAWAPGKKRIAFASNRDGDWEVYWVNADGTGLTQLTDNPAWDGEPAWSPDGNYIAFTSDRDGKREVYLAGPDGVARVTYTPGRSESWEPAWGPGGTIFFTSNRDGKQEVYRTTESGKVVRVTYAPGDGESWSPAWSWIGSYTAFVSDRDGQPEIYILLEGGVLRRVSYTSGGSGSWEPVPSSSGQLMAFTSDRDGRPEIYTITQEGALFRLTNTTGNNQSWSPAW